MRESIRKRGNPGSWEYILELGKQLAQRCEACNKRYWLDRTRLARCPACGGQLSDVEERRQVTKGGFATAKEAAEAHSRAKVEVAEHRYVVVSDITVADYLMNEWLPSVKTTIRPSTHVSYAGHVSNHIIPGIGSLQLQALTPAAINARYAYLLENGRGQGRGLSPATVHHVHVTLHRALRDAVRWRRLHHNPADAADPPRASAHRKEMEVWTGDELRTFLTSVSGSPLYPLWLLLSTTGMRRGEALGLHWEDLAVASRKVSIRRSLSMLHGLPVVTEPKTRRGSRTIPLDPATVDALVAHRRGQYEARMLGGDKWTDSLYVFTKPLGDRLDPNYVTLCFKKAVKAAGLRPIRLHSLRHTYATLALAAGMNPRDLSARLGHSTVAFTLDVYSHAVAALEVESADAVAALIVPSLEGPREEPCWQNVGNETPA